MSKFIKDQISQLKPSATLAINEESNKLKKSGKKVYKFGFGQSPFPVPESVVSALKVSCEYISSENITILYFLAILLISSKFLQIVPEGLFGELIKSKIFLFLISLILSSNIWAVGNQLESLVVFSQ